MGGRLVRPDAAGLVFPPFRGRVAVLHPVMEVFAALLERSGRLVLAQG